MRQAEDAAIHVVQALPDGILLTLDSSGEQVPVLRGGLRQAEPDLQQLLQSENPANRVDFLRSHRAASQPAERVDRLQRSTGQAVTRSMLAGVARVSTRITRAATFTGRDDPRHGEDRSNTARTCENRLGKVRPHGDVVEPDFRNQDRPSAPAGADNQPQQEQRDDGFISHSFLWSLGNGCRVSTAHQQLIWWAATWCPPRDDWWAVPTLRMDRIVESLA